MAEPPPHPPMPKASACIAEHPRAVCRDVWLGALLPDRSGRVEGRREIEELTGAEISSILTAECAKEPRRAQRTQR